MSSKLQPVLNIIGLVYISRASSIQVPPYLNTNTMGGRLRPGLCVVSGVVDVNVRRDLDRLRELWQIESRSKLISLILTSYLDDLRRKEA